jgi:hypothetical protein
MLGINDSGYEVNLFFDIAIVYSLCVDSVYFEKFIHWRSYYG